jgi:hypothetical protein
VRSEAGPASQTAPPLIRPPRSRKRRTRRHPIRRAHSSSR